MHDVMKIDIMFYNKLLQAEENNVIFSKMRNKWEQQQERCLLIFEDENDCLPWD